MKLLRFLRALADLLIAKSLSFKGGDERPPAG
jgi:hypothetical protein